MISKIVLMECLGFCIYIRSFTNMDILTFSFPVLTPYISFVIALADIPNAVLNEINENSDDFLIRHLLRNVFQILLVQ